MALIKLRLVIFLASSLLVFPGGDAAAQTVTLKVGQCAGVDGPILPGSQVGCAVSVGPAGVALKAYAFATCIVKAEPVTVAGNATLWFRMAPKAVAGKCPITLFFVNESTNAIENTAEASVEVGSAILPTSK